MAKYTKNFDSMVGETNDYWGKDGLVRFVESLLGPADSEVEVKISLKSNRIGIQDQHRTKPRRTPTGFDGDSLAEAA